MFAFWCCVVLQISSQAVTSQVTIVQGSYYCMPQNATKYNSFPTPIVTWQRETSATDPNGYAFQAVKYDNRVIRVRYHVVTTFIRILR